VRADRLVAVLMLLQTREKVTAAEVARELEVSERTARRDLEALAMAGVPIYSTQGRHGGWRLVGGARTDLSGLNAQEARALFLVAGPASATPEVRAALRKLVRALPEPFRSDAEAASAAVVVDPAGWGRTPDDRPPPPHLEALQSAVIEGRQVRLGYVARDRNASERVVHPLGLAAKGSAWYLVADTPAGLRTFRVDRVTSAELTGDAVVRPPDFDLAEAWRLITAEVDERRHAARAHGTAEARIMPMLRGTLGARLRIGPADADGRIEVEMSGWSDQALAVELAGLGDGLVVDAPPTVVDELGRIARELTAVYGSVSSAGKGKARSLPVRARD
jgi:predicted DNA-binding transcriptional regulator YafY